MITSLINRVGAIRQNIEVYHEQWYMEAMAIAKRLNIKETKPRTNKRQIYRVSLTIPLLDTVSEELKSRFSQNSLVA